MTKIRATLKEKGRVICEAEGSNQSVTTDLPKPYGGHGEHMGATELLGASLAGCMLAMMMLKGKQLGVDLAGTTVEVDKQLVSDPHLRVASLGVHIRIPQSPDQAVRAKLEDAAKHCPVHRSLHPDVKQTITFEWVGS